MAHLVRHHLNTPTVKCDLCGHHDDFMTYSSLDGLQQLCQPCYSRRLCRHQNAHHDPVRPGVRAWDPREAGSLTRPTVHNQGLGPNHVFDDNNRGNRHGWATPSFLMSEQVRTYGSSREDERDVSTKRVSNRIQPPRYGGEKVSRSSYYQHI